jgi:NDP-4-keto-2,6-dideoxyhexose 3-C-methyltransferase
MSTEAQPEIFQTYTKRTSCRACGAGSITHVLDLGIQYLPRFVKEPDQTLPKAPLHLVRCAACGLLQLEHTVNPDLLYREFWYRSGINQTMREALGNLVANGIRYVSEGRWLDIGANDGYLLSRVPISFHKTACEPALNFRADLEEHADEAVMEYFSHEAVDGKTFTMITSAAMFYDLDDPGHFLDSIRLSLEPGGFWINQLNDSPTMIKANAFDSICHEHLCYYDLWTLQGLYKRHGLTIVDLSFNDVNGGSARVTARRTADVMDGEPMSLLGVPKLGSAEVEGFAARTEAWRDVFGAMIEHLTGAIWCYGASTKGSTLLQYLGSTVGLVTAVADRNPMKHGLKMVGTWHPIRSEAEFRETRPSYAIVLPWAFKSEFDERERTTRARGTKFIYPLPDISVVL